MCDNLVVGWAPADGNAQLEPLFHVVHSDGDEEDLEPWEVELGILYFEHDVRAAYSKPIECRKEVERYRNILNNEAEIERIGLGSKHRSITPKPRRRHEEPTTLIPRRTSERLTYIAACKASLLEVSAAEGEALYRPTWIAEDAMAKASKASTTDGVAYGCRARWEDVVAVLQGSSRDGPFHRHRAEVSAERAVELAYRDGATFVQLNVSELGHGEAFFIGVQAAFEDSGICENDYVCIMHGLPCCCNLRRLPSFASREGIRRMAADYVAIKSKIDNAWHEQGWAKWTNDPHGKLRRSTEVGTV